MPLRYTERPGHLRLVATVLGLKRNFLRDINVWQTASPGRNSCCVARRTVDGCFRAEHEIRSAAVVAQSRFYGNGDPYACAFHRSEYRDFLNRECAHAEEPALFAS